jgi:hypothetical protein
MVLVEIGGVVASRFFGNSSDDSGDGGQGDDPIVKFLFGAANAADYTDVDTYIADDFTAYVNGHRMGNDSTNKGQKLLTDVLHYYDQNIGNSFWKLYQEVDEDPGKDKRSMAIRFVASGSFDGDKAEIEMAGFLTVADKKLTEIRLVTDLTQFNRMRKKTDLPPLD